MPDMTLRTAPDAAFGATDALAKAAAQASVETGAPFHVDANAAQASHAADQIAAQVTPGSLTRRGEGRGQAGGAADGGYDVMCLHVYRHKRTRI